VSSDTHYARTPDGGHVAYQVLGDGPVDLVCLGYGNMISIDMRDDEPHFARFERRLSSFTRFIRFDPRGIGLSDPIAPQTPRAVEDGVADLIAVLDAVGSKRAAIFAVGNSCHAGLLTCAEYPDRISSLVLMHCYARLVWADDYDWGVPRSSVDAFLDSVLDLDATEATLDDVRMLAPSLASDAEYRAWWRRAGQRGASPATARAILKTALLADVRSTLPLIKAPTLVLHRTENELYSRRHSRYLAAHIGNARLVELPGIDNLPFAGDSDAIVDEIDEFLTGVRGSAEADRVLTTLLFTDIVGSTERATNMGDAAWRVMLDQHDAMVRSELRRFRGREVKTTGDGILATFDGPARAIHCAEGIHHGARRLGIEVRAGLHTGEVDARGSDISGIAVHIAQRVSALAGPNEILVSRTVVDLVAGSGLAFDDHGESQLKGVTGSWQLYAVRLGPAQPAEHS
jgi:class 3 adenylate cyclase/pimeloyl-ACP methyl ester carboxylesterase